MGEARREGWKPTLGCSTQEWFTYYVNSEGSDKAVEVNHGKDNFK